MRFLGIARQSSLVFRRQVIAGARRRARFGSRSLGITGYTLPGAAGSRPTARHYVTSASAYACLAAAADGPPPFDAAGDADDDCLSRFASRVARLYFPRLMSRRRKPAMAVVAAYTILPTPERLMRDDAICFQCRRRFSVISRSMFELLMGTAAAYLIKPGTRRRAHLLPLIAGLCRLSVLLIMTEWLMPPT